MTDWTTERKAHTAFRAAGVLILLAGGYGLVGGAGLTLAAIKAIWRREWFELLEYTLMLGMILIFSGLCLCAGWRVARTPERANPRLMLMAVFILLYLTLFGQGSLVLFDAHGLDTLRASLRPWEKLYNFAVMLLCALLYYASCRRLRRVKGLTDAQQATLAVPPSLELCGLIGLFLLFAAQAFIHQYARQRGMAPLLGPWLISCAFAFWFSRFLHRKLSAYLAPPVPRNPGVS